MTFEIQNTGADDFIIDYGGSQIGLARGETKTINTDGGRITVRMSYRRDDRFKTLRYLLNEIFIYEQMCAELAVDGVYSFESEGERAVIKVRSHEFRFSDEVSYQTPVFQTEGCTFTRDQLEVANSEKIYKRAKFLYLLGGWKTLFPVSVIGLIIMLCTFLGTVSDIVWTLGFLAVAIIMGIKYFKSLKFLKKTLKPDAVAGYLASDRFEYHSFLDQYVPTDSTDGYS